MKPVTAAMPLMSLLLMVVMVHAPIPFQLKMVSVNTAPTMRVPNWNAKNVAIGMSAVRRPCL